MIDGLTAGRISSRYSERIKEGTLKAMPDSEYTWGKVAVLNALGGMMQKGGPYSDGVLAGIMELAELCKAQEELDNWILRGAGDAHRG
jgi:hypothetical protein